MAVDCRLSPRHQCGIAAKGQMHFWAASAGLFRKMWEVIVPLYLAPARPCLVYAVQFWDCILRRTRRS